MRHEQRYKALMSKFGYIVLATYLPCPIGHKLDRIEGSQGGELEQPFAVISKATEEDAEQQELFLRTLGKEAEAVGGWQYYYKVSTD